MATYPAAVKTFTTKNNGDTIQASHITDLQDEVTAIEDGLLNGTAPVNSSRITAASLQVAGGSTFAGIVTNANQPRCVVYHNTTQSIATGGTGTALTFNTEDLDVGAMHDTGSNPTRVTIPTGGDGLYWVRGGTLFTANATGYRVLILRKNGTTNVRSATQIGSATAGQEFEVSGVLALVAGDYVELLAFQNSGGALNVGSSSAREDQSSLEVVKLW